MAGEYINPWWQAKLLPEKWDVCGVKIGGLSVWHFYALTELRNAYVCGGVCDLDAAANLLLVCGREVFELKALYLNPRVRARVLNSIYKTVKCIPWAELNAACIDYITACTRIPEHLRPMEGKGKSFSAPGPWHIVLCLCERYNLTPDQAWNHPYAEARCMFDVFQEARGDETLASETIQRHTDEALERKAGEKKP